MRSNAKSVVLTASLVLALFPQAPLLQAEDSDSPAVGQGSAPAAADFTAETLQLLNRHHVRPAVLHGKTLPLGYGVLLDVHDPASVRFLAGTNEVRLCGSENFSIIVRADGTVVGFQQQELSPKAIVVHRVGKAVVVIDFRKSVMTWLTLN